MRLCRDGKCKPLSSPLTQHLDLCNFALLIVLLLVLAQNSCRKSASAFEPWVFQKMEGHPQCHQLLNLRHEKWFYTWQSGEEQFGEVGSEQLQSAWQACSAGMYDVLHLAEAQFLTEL